MSEMNENDHMLHDQLNVYEKLESSGGIDEILQQRNDRHKLNDLVESDEQKQESKLGYSDDDSDLIDSLVEDEYVEDEDEFYDDGCDGSDCCNSA